jgi:predicted dithiol-disulfide oxidoreductase (DUF899 family)
MADQLQHNIKNQEKDMNKEKDIEIPKVKALAARLGLLKAEKELTQRSDELARRRQHTNDEGQPKNGE